MVQDEDKAETGRLTLPQRRIVIEAADYLMSTLSAELTELSDGALYAAGASVHAICCLALEGLGMMRPAGRRRSWHVCVPEDAVRRAIETRMDLVRSHLDETLQAFLELAAGHLRTLPDTRQPFLLPAEHQRIGGALLAAGYLARVDDAKVRWTERIRPYMQEAMLWDPEGACLSELYAAQELAAARLFLAALPRHLRGLLTRTVRADGAVAGLSLLQRYWTGTGWSEVPSVHERDLVDEQFQVTVYMTVAQMIVDGDV